VNLSFVVNVTKIIITRRPVLRTGKKKVLINADVARRNATLSKNKLVTTNLA